MVVVVGDCGVDGWQQLAAATKECGSEPPWRLVTAVGGSKPPRRLVGDRRWWFQTSAAARDHRGVSRPPRRLVTTVGGSEPPWRLVTAA